MKDCCLSLGPGINSLVREKQVVAMGDSADGVRGVAAKTQSQRLTRYEKERAKINRVRSRYSERRNSLAEQRAVGPPGKVSYGLFLARQ